MKKLALVSLIVIVFAAVFLFDVQQYLSLEQFQQRHRELQQLVQEHYVLSIFLFFIAYTLTAALALPFAAIITLLAGLLFGIIVGTILVSFASTLGASLCFLIARYIARDFFERRYENRISMVNHALQRDGKYYLFFLRLVPLFPFFLINIVMGLTKIPLKTFYWISQIGMLPGTIVYVNAGTQISTVESLSDITSPNILLAFLLLAIFPFIARTIANLLRNRKVYAGFEKPAHFDFNVIVIGAGSAGLVCAYTASMLKAKTALVERGKMGGDCLNTGCVPSKALLRSAKLASELQNSAAFGIKGLKSDINFDDVIQRVHEKIDTIAPNDSVARYSRLGVNCYQGNAEVLSPWQVEIDGQIISTRNIIIATGARPRIPDINGLDLLNYYTTESIWNLRQLPEKLLIIGGGPIGCELGQAFARLGSLVSILEAEPRLLPREDSDAVERVVHGLQSSGVTIYCHYLPVRINRRNSAYVILATKKNTNQEIEIEFTHVLVATGRTANLDGLDKLKLETNATGQLLVNEFMQTRLPNVYACGDVVGPHQYTHAASNQAWYAAANALFSPFKKFRLNEKLLPRAVFTDPEIAAVGVSEQQAVDQQIAHEITLLPLRENDRSIVDEATEGFIKIITANKSDRILGVTISGEHASELLSEFLLAMNAGVGLKKILRTIHIYPTRSEIARQAAGQWRKKRFSQKTQNILQRYHQWRR